MFHCPVPEIVDELANRLFREDAECAIERLARRPDVQCTVKDEQWLTDRVDNAFTVRESI